MALTLFSNDLYKTHWICKVKSILDNCGLSYMWENQCTLDNSTCKNIIFRRIDDIALNRWYTDLSVSSLCTFYRQLKQKLCFEKYLLMPNSRERISLTKYRYTNSKLPIYKHIYLYDSDICTLCNLNSKGDEYHYILICPFFRKERELYLKRYYYTIPSIHKFINLFCSTNKRTQRCLARLANIVMTSFST